MNEQVTRYALINDTGTWTASMRKMGNGAWMLVVDHDRDIKALNTRIAALESLRRADARAQERMRKRLDDYEYSVADCDQGTKALEKRCNRYNHKIGDLKDDKRILTNHLNASTKTRTEQAEKIKRLQKTMVQHVAGGGTKENDDLKRTLDAEDVSWATFGAYQMSPLTEGESG